jgi:DNA-binding CsgD family transcriptional regulator
VLILTPVTAAQAPPVELVRSLFDLTPAETRVARAIAAGGSVEDIAAAANLSVNTIRSQLNRVFMKTGCTRQGELVALLGGIGRTGVQSE